MPRSVSPNLTPKVPITPSQAIVEIAKARFLFHPRFLNKLDINGKQKYMSPPQ